MRPFLLLTVCCLLHLLCRAAIDTLTLKEKMELRDALMQTTLGANFQADIYSQKGDSAKAGEYLVKSDPHYMMFLGQTPETLPEFLSRFKSPKADKDRYIHEFTKAYNAPKNEYYHAFRGMKIEDQKIRKQIENCSNKDSCKLLHKQMIKTDSAHSAYLYNYVKNNGWPKIEDGGLYANLLAIHDHKNHAFYIPHLKAAIKQGQNIMDALEILYYYNSREQHGEALQGFLDTAQKVSFDVSSLLNFKLPTSISEIRKAFREHCPVDYYLVLYSYKPEIAEDWSITADARRHTDPQGHILVQFFSRARKDCPRYKGDVGETWQLNYLRSDTRRSKMMLYVLYK